MKDTKDERKKFGVIMWGIAEDFGGKISKQGLELRFQALKDYSIEQIRAAGTWLLKNREATFPAVPRTKEFVDLIEGFNEPKISTQSLAEIQAALVLKYLRHYGFSQTPTFEDPITQQLMSERWPWYRWASTMKEDQEQWWSKQFVTLYKANSEQEEANTLLNAPEKFKKIAVGLTKSLED